MRSSKFLILALPLLIVGCSKGFSSASSSLSANSVAGPQPSTNSPTAASNVQSFGLNVDFNEQSFGDLIQPTTSLSAMTGSLTSDAQGWPQQDFQFSIDNRYNFAWVSGALNIDPLQLSTDLSGTYILSFNGQATLAGWGNVSIANQVYNSATNTTTAQVILPSVSTGVLFGVQLTQTLRVAGGLSGSGVTNLHLYRPGFNSSVQQPFTELWLHPVRDVAWSALRFMGAMGTNSYGQAATAEAYPYLLQWATDRTLPGLGPLYAANHVGTHGPPWEYVVQAAQQSKKDVWINIPVNASDDYVKQLATLMHDGNASTGNAGLPTTANVYLEYSNEMWHLGFPQGPWNKQAAIDEVAGGSSNLNDDAIGNQDMWRFRRIAQRTIQIGVIFRSVFSDRPAQIRPVINNAWQGFYADMLNYVTRNYGAPANSLYAIAQTGYYSSADASSVAAVLQGEMANSDTNRNGYLQSRAIATFYGLHAFVYEGGEGETGNPQAPTPLEANLTNLYAAARSPGMQQVIAHDLLQNWYPSGGELYMEFSQVGRYSVYGFWGLSEDLTNLLTGKWLGVQQVLATPPVALSYATELPLVSGQSVSIPEVAPPGSNFTLPTDQPWLEFSVHASLAGNYTLRLQGVQTAVGTMQIWIDNALAGSVSLPSSGGSPDPMSVPVTVILGAGNHAVFVYGPAGVGPTGVRAAGADQLLISK